MKITCILASLAYTAGWRVRVTNYSSADCSGQAGQPIIEDNPYTLPEGYVRCSSSARTSTEKARGVNSFARSFLAQLMPASTLYSSASGGLRFRWHQVPELPGHYHSKLDRLHVLLYDQLSVRVHFFRTLLCARVDVCLPPPCLRRLAVGRIRRLLWQRRSWHCGEGAHVQPPGWGQRSLGRERGLPSHRQPARRGFDVYPHDQHQALRRLPRPHSGSCPPSRWQACTCA
mmetsp:Transcript_28112/g.78391  ORF Transcript_28112/g.78391 Transcript_28112/m.78391 type:complete len:230 (-) Transcript_28112:193-882(-)